MKKKNLIIALTLVLSLGVGVTAYADSKTPTTTSSSVTCSGYGFGKVAGIRGYDFMTNILKNKFGISDSDISNARNSGKTMYDIARDKGITEDQFKSAMVEERTKAVDEAVKNASITKEQGENIKSNIKENSSNCIPGKGAVNGKRGGGSCRGNGFFSGSN
ncbi:hypothetical protein [Clostridium aciditolerans]|uniref:Uncharacterized protein n=1 Tax=Clostridium aciditolerans TaxID=339861 RepID=A0A934HYA5_9CLOT|nr:hypothetical protein [Clostridium aciditolerans]MBI6875553.1 hypothetical protein [Clostridium aciditolerans]